jgi:tetratricopeptide (TPR) repeat protein
MKIKKNTSIVYQKIFLLAAIAWLLIGCRAKRPAIGDLDNVKINQVKPIKFSIVQKLKENANLTIDERIALFYELKKIDKEAYNFKDEDGLTMYGYSFLWENKLAEALAIFKLIVTEFPNSSNAYDSLAEAYLKNNNKELALNNYEKAFALNPENFNAEDQIEKIRFPERVADSPKVKFVKIFSSKQYRDDLDQLGQTLIKIHPNALKFITKEAFWKSIETKKSLITDGTTYGEFAWHCSEIIANVNCSHTNMGSFDYEAAMLPISLRFPLQVRWIKNQLFVVDPLNNNKNVKIKDEIISINGVEVAKIISESYKHIPSQGYIESTKNHFFNTWCTSMIPYALDFPKKFEILLKEANQPIPLDQATSVKDPFFERPIDFSGNNLTLKFIDKNIALMTVGTFNYYRWSDFDLFKNFVDSSFNEINKNGVKNLIIDVRFNPGGSQSASMHLLRYLSNKPFTYFSNVQFEGKNEKIEGEDKVMPFEDRFKGKCYFLIDGKGNSTTGHFMSIVKYLNLGTIVGEELGSNQFCSAGMTTRRLKNTKLEYYIANNTHESLAINLPDEKGILPDHFITQNIEEYLKKIDTVKEFTIRLINKN